MPLTQIEQINKHFDDIIREYTKSSELLVSDRTNTKDVLVAFMILTYCFSETFIRLYWHWTNLHKEWLEKENKERLKKGKELLPLDYGRPNAVSAKKWFDDVAINTWEYKKNSKIISLNRYTFSTMRNSIVHWWGFMKNIVICNPGLSSEEAIAVWKKFKKRWYVPSAKGELFLVHPITFREMILESARMTLDHTWVSNDTIEQERLAIIFKEFEGDYRDIFEFEDLE
jgi:hypothetical protein